MEINYINVKDFYGQVLKNYEIYKDRMTKEDHLNLKGCLDRIKRIITEYENGDLSIREFNVEVEQYINIYKSLAEQLSL